MATRRNQNTFLQRLQTVSIRPKFFSRNAYGDNLELGDLFRRKGMATSGDFGSEIKMDESDYYVGLMYGAITLRAKKTARLARTNIKTIDQNDPESEDVDQHPYLKLIRTSRGFSDFYFWKAMSTYLDLPKGVAMVMAIRNFVRPGEVDEVSGLEATDDTGTIFGDIQAFDIINPYDVTKVMGQDGKVGGYVETRDGTYRTIPPEQMIIIRDLNPFSLRDGYGMARAARDSQFSLRQAESYSRQAIGNNVAQRGLITTEVVLDDAEFENFEALVNQQKGAANAGKFLIGNGPGSINYTDMQIDLDKLALDKITNISRENLFGASGVGKTNLSIEQSGVTRDTSKTMKEQLIEDQVIPQIQIIIDAFNQDFRNAYPDDYEETPLDLDVESPADLEAAKLEADVKKTKAETANILVRAGFDPMQALDAAEIDDELAWVGMPSGLPGDPAGSGDGPGTGKTESSESLRRHLNHFYREQFDESLMPIIRGAQSTLKHEVSALEGRVFDSVQKRIRKKYLSKNALTAEQQAAVITKTEREKHEKELAGILAAFHRSVINLFAGQTLSQRTAEFGLRTTFSMNKEVEAGIQKLAGKGAKSHLNTILSDVYQTASQAAKAGKSYAEIASELQRTFTNISQKRANVIAITETNFAVADAQYEADKQFLDEHNLRGRAFKKWRTHSGNPCPFCREMASAPPIPFDDNFLSEGDTVEATFEHKDGSTVNRTFVADYRDVNSGGLHTGCWCSYELIIEPEI